MSESWTKQAQLRDFSDTEMPASFSTLLPAASGESQRTIHDRILVPLIGSFGKVAAVCALNWGGGSYKRRICART